MITSYPLVQVLSLFMMGYALLTTAMNQPFGFPDDYDGNDTNPDALDFETLLKVQSDSFRVMTKSHLGGSGSIPLQEILLLGVVEVNICNYFIPHFRNRLQKCRHAVEEQISLKSYRRQKKNFDDGSVDVQLQSDISFKNCRLLKKIAVVDMLLRQTFLKFVKL
jgi:hypothetical protein